MGRYYNGMIEGKFWFGLQSSTAADRFGVSYSEPSYVEYYFSEDDLQGVQEEIENILEDLGEKIEVMDKYFGSNNSNDMLTESGISTKEIGDYADLLLGIKIRDCIRDEGHCTFDAEL